MWPKLEDRGDVPRGQRGQHLFRAEFAQQMPRRAPPSQIIVGLAIDEGLSRQRRQRCQ
ncbi:hypothetical protein Abr02nite_26890 [Paractinoplanes brasiliensis]|nr:hypothetical protein Abr02nite_26890 [Actinoplanes brasiliensis]